ncbi:MAG: hypothetical protein P1P64_03305 [Treponemataceae bacterium]
MQNEFIKFKHILWVVLRWVLLIAVAMYPIKTIFRYAKNAMGTELAFGQELDFSCNEKNAQNDPLVKSAQRVIKILEKIYNKKYDKAVIDISELKISSEIQIPENVIEFLDSFVEVYNYLGNDKFYKKNKSEVRDMRKKYKKSTMPAETYIFNNVQSIVNFFKEVGFSDGKAMQYAEIIPYYCLLKRMKNDEIILIISEKYLDVFIRSDGSVLSEYGADAVCIYIRSLYRENTRLFERQEADAQKRFKGIQKKISELRTTYSKYIGPNNPSYTNHAGYLDRINEQCKALSNARGIAFIGVVVNFFEKTQFNDSIKWLDE